MDHVLNHADRRFKAMRRARPGKRLAVSMPAPVATSGAEVEPAPDRYDRDLRSTHESAALTVMVELQHFNRY